MDNQDNLEGVQDAPECGPQAFGEDFAYVAITAIVVCTYSIINLASFLV
jgi:hypothetical protein